MKYLSTSPYGCDRCTGSEISKSGKLPYFFTYQYRLDLYIEEQCEGSVKDSVLRSLNFEENDKKECTKLRSQKRSFININFISSKFFLKRNCRNDGRIIYQMKQ